MFQFLSHSILTNLLRLCFTLVKCHAFSVSPLSNVHLCQAVMGDDSIVQWGTVLFRNSGRIFYTTVIPWLAHSECQDPPPPVGYRASAPWSGLAEAGCIQNTPTQPRTDHCHSLALRVYLPYLGLWSLEYTFENLYSTNFREIIL